MTSSGAILDASPGGIRIEITNGKDQVFHPGDKVSGNIVLDSSIKRIRSATVKLSGMCHTKSPICGLTKGERHMNLDNFTLLFRREKELTVMNQLLEPFEMVFPESTDPENSTPKRHRLAEGSLPLPPTFRVAKERDADYAIGSIQYLVAVEVISEHADTHTPLRYRDSVELLVCCKDANFNEFPKHTATFKAQPVSRRCSDWRFESPSFMKRLKRVLDPKITLDPTVTHRPVFPRCEIQTYRLNLDSKSSGTDVAVMPVQNLENVNIILESHTDIAGCRFIGLKRHVQNHQTVHQPVTAMPIQQNMTHILVKIPEPSTPDFVTYTLQHTHKLKFTATVRIGRKRFPLQSYSPIKIVPNCETPPFPLSETPFYCTAHDPHFSGLPSYLNSPSIVQTPSTLRSYCSVCRHDDALRAAKDLMDPIQEDPTVSDIHSLNSPEIGFRGLNKQQASPEPPRQPQIAPRQHSDGADDDADRNVNANLLAVTDAKRDRPTGSRSDSAYVSAIESEKSKTASKLPLAPGEKAAGKQRRESYDQNMASFEEKIQSAMKSREKGLDKMPALSRMGTA